MIFMFQDPVSPKPPAEPGEAEGVPSQTNPDGGDVEDALEDVDLKEAHG